MDVTSPITIEENIIIVLQNALNQDPQILKPAEAKLNEWETQSGFYSYLINILSNPMLDVNVKWISVIYLKNGIEKYWRSSAPNAISEQEKLNIKQCLLSDFNEPINQIALQKAVIISKIARIDCPKNWPELFPTLVHVIENCDSGIQQRALLTLHHVVKVMSTKRLMGDRRFFIDFTSNIYSFILNLWNNFTQKFLNDIYHNSDKDIIISNLEKALLTLRILRKLNVYGIYKPHENEDCMKFLHIIFDILKQSLYARKKICGGKVDQLIEICEKFIIHLTKVLLSMLDTHPLSFIEFIQSSLEFTVWSLFTIDGIQLCFQRFNIQCFNLIKNILLCAEYKITKGLDINNRQLDAIKAHQLKINFFTKPLLDEILQKLILHYFLLKDDELEMWTNDSETFVTDESGDSWKYSLRPCVETIFVTIFHEFRELLAPVLVKLLDENECIVSVNDKNGILRKDAIYNAISLCAYDLYDEIDFDKWFTNTLIIEIKTKDFNYRILRRRVCALIGRWCSVHLSLELRPFIYESIINLLRSDEDMVVRLTASRALRSAIDDFEFNFEQFQKYLDLSFNLLFNLLKDTNECDTKIHVLNVMSLIVERVGYTIKPHSDNLINYLPLLWTESENHNMLRCAIVTILVHLVKALGVVSNELNPFLFPIIQLGIDINQSAIVYLLEDCLELWLTVLQNSTIMTNELMQLFNNMPTLLEYNTENLGLCLLITVVHTLLSPELVMRTHGTQIITVCDNLMSDLKNEGIIMVIKVIDMFLKTLPVLGCETVYTILPRIFQKIYIGEDYPLLMSRYLSILSRVLLSSHSVFTRVLGTLSQITNESNEIVLDKILDMWLKKMPAVTQTEQRKLLGLALCNLITTNSQPVYQRFGSIMINILEALNDITKCDDTGKLEDLLLLIEGRSPSEFQSDDDVNYETEHDQRNKQLLYSDPVYTVVLKDYLQSQMIQLKNQIGLQQYEQLIQIIDADTFSQLKVYIKF